MGFPSSTANGGAGSLARRQMRARPRGWRRAHSRWVQAGFQGSRRVGRPSRWGWSGRAATRPAAPCWGGMPQAGRRSTGVGSRCTPVPACPARLGRIRSVASPPRGGESLPEAAPDEAGPLVHEAARQPFPADVSSMEIASVHSARPPTSGMSHQIIRSSPARPWSRAEVQRRPGAATAPPGCARATVHGGVPAGEAPGSAVLIRTTGRWPPPQRCGQPGGLGPDGLRIWRGSADLLALRRCSLRTSASTTGSLRWNWRGDLRDLGSDARPGNPAPAALRITAPRHFSLFETSR